MTTIEAKDAQIGVTYRNKSGMEATALGGGMFHTAFGDLDIEPDEPLTEIGALVAPAAASEAPPPVVVERFIELPAAAALPEDVAVEPPAAVVAEAPAVVEAAPATTAPAEGFLRPRCECSECGEDVSLVKGEVARKHWRGARTDANLCPGSGKPPKGAVAAEVVPPVPKVDAPWVPAVGDRVVTTETGDEIAVVVSVDPEGAYRRAYRLRWEDGTVTGGWASVDLRLEVVVAPEAEPVAVAPFPGDTLQAQESAEGSTLEAVCAAMSGPKDDQGEPSEGVQRLFSDDLDPADGVPIAFTAPLEREEWGTVSIEDAPHLENWPEAGVSIFWLPAQMGATVAVSTLPEDDEEWLDCATNPPDDGAEVWTEDEHGDRRLATVYSHHGLSGRPWRTFIGDGSDAAGLDVVRWKPWKKAQPDQTTEIARLTARVEVLTAEAEAANAACAGAEGAARDMLGTLAKIGVALAYGPPLTEEEAARRLRVPENRAALVPTARRLASENEAHRAAERASANGCAPQEDAAARLALEELVGSLQAQLEVAEAKVARYHKAARRAAGAVLAALGDEP